MGGEVIETSLKNMGSGWEERGEAQLLLPERGKDRKEKKNTRITIRRF